MARGPGKEPECRRPELCLSNILPGLLRKQTFHYRQDGNGRRIQCHVAEKLLINWSINIKHNFPLALNINLISQIYPQEEQFNLFQLGILNFK